MSRTLLWLSRKSAGYILALAWAIVLVGYGLSSVDSSRPVLALGQAFAAVVLFGYPSIVIFGFPARCSSNLTRLVSLLASLSLVALCIVSALLAHRNLDPSMPWFLKPLGGVLGLLCFSPFFLATHVLGEARRALHTHKVGDSIVAFLGFFYRAFGGVFFVHRTVVDAVDSLMSQSTGRTVGRHAV